MTQFSPQLIKRAQKYFADYHNVIISDEKANEYLNSFADFFRIVVEDSPDELNNQNQMPGLPGSQNRQTG